MANSPSSKHVSGFLFLRAVWHVAEKDCRMFLRYPLQAFGTLIWPLLFATSAVLLARGLAGPNLEGISSFAKAANTADYISFVVYGNVLFSFINLCFWGGGLSLTTARQQGILETHWLTPGRGLAFVFGKTLGSLVQQFIPSILIIVILHILGFIAFKTTLPAFLLVAAAALPFLLGLLVTFAALTLRVMEGGHVILVVRTLLAVFCGISFPLATFPEPVTRVARLIPLTRLLDIIRDLTIHGASLSSRMSDIIYLAVSGMVLLGFALVLFVWLEKHVRRHGLLSGY